MSFFEELSWHVRFGWAHARAALGSAKAAHNLGRYYETTQTDRKDMSKAVLYYMKAANKGYFHAQKKLGLLYAEGKGVKQDEQKSLFWLQKVAEHHRIKAQKGDADAQWRYAYCFVYGEGVEKDPEQAVLWYTKSAEQGNAKGQTNLGHCY